MKTLLSLVLVVCLSPVHAASPRPNANALQQDVAVDRAARVSKTRYELSFSLDAEKEDFTGTVRALFQLKDASKPLTLDFAGGKIQSVSVNGRAVAEPDYNGFFLTLPGNVLAEGANDLRIAFTHPYSKSGDGLYRFKDPTDGRAYTYSDFEPYDANGLFPCFDQPDIKATYTLEAEVPADWQVVSSTLEKDIAPVAGGRKLWKFPETKPFSTYIFSLHAGPYKEWKSDYKGMPLRLFARQSMVPYVDAEDWFDTTKKGFAFYEEFFDYPYPFGKYDQLIVPDFNAGAMENVAAVTFSERNAPRYKPSRKERLYRASVILHEMAHMWFGDLVTMRWWDDLWLNESFATYMAALSLQEATEYNESWQTFYTRLKTWGYWEDQLVTTHPIETPVPDTEQAFVNFDGITYAKGASALKQIAYDLGRENFRAGVRRYFKDYAFKNARREDFVGSLEKASKRDLKPWTKEWLQTAGLNTVSAAYECKDGKISAFTLKQSAPKDQPALRRHPTAIGLYSAQGGVLKPSKILENVTYSGESTPVPALAGEPCPDLVNPNQGDNDYVKVSLDPRSLETAKKGLTTVSGGLDRAMLWVGLWDMVQDAELNVLDYVEIIHTHLPKEKDPLILEEVLETVYGETLRSPSVLLYLAGDAPQWKKRYDKEVARFETLFWAEFAKSEPKSDRQRHWFDGYAKVAQTKGAMERLARALDGKEDLHGMELDQDRRWSLVAQLNRRAASGAEAALEAELKRDPSHTGKLQAIRARVIRPDWKAKRDWLDRMTSPKSGESLAEFRAAMRNIFPYDQADLRRRFAEEFYASFKTLIPAKPNEFLWDYADYMAPMSCRPQDSAQLSSFLDANASFSPVITVPLRMARQIDERCVKIRGLAEPAVRSQSGR